MFSPNGDDDDGILDEILQFLGNDGNDESVTNATPGLSPSKPAFVGQSNAQPLPNVVVGTMTTSLASQGQLGSVDSTTFGRCSGGGPKRHRDAHKVKELEVLAAEKTEQFAALELHNAELRYRSKILSEVIMLRDCQLRIGQSGGQVIAPWSSHPLAATIPVSSGGVSSPDVRCSVARLVHQPGSVRFLLAPELLSSVDRDRLRGTDRLQLAARWKAFLSEATQLLLRLQENPDDEEAALRMRTVTADVTSLLRHASVLSPAAMLGFLQTHLESLSLSETEQGHWAQVLQAMRLDDDQLQDLRAMYGLFTSMMRGILAERKTLQARLSEGLQVCPRAAVSQLTVPPEGEVLPSLERNMRKEAAAHLLVRGFVFGRTLSVVQMCQAGVRSYPFFPNATGLVAAAAGVDA